MIDFTDDEQISIICAVDSIIKGLANSLKTEPEIWQIHFGRVAEKEISCLQSIREKINEDRRCQGRIEL